MKHLNEHKELVLKGTSKRFNIFILTLSQLSKS